MQKLGKLAFSMLASGTLLYFCPTVKGEMPSAPSSLASVERQTPMASAHKVETTGDALYYSQPDNQSAPTFVIRRPELQALISIRRNLDPFQLDAQAGKAVQLRDVVEAALFNNLDIKISQQNVRSSLWKMYNSYSGFLPDLHSGFADDSLNGHLRLPFTLGVGSLLPVHSPLIITQAGVSYNVFQGGRILFTALESKHTYRSTRWQFHASTNDVLLEGARRYYNLVLAEALLQIRIRAVETSEEQVRLNTDLERQGLATHLDVLQAQSQLADDSQNLIEQQVARRNAAIQLSDFLNLEQAMDLQPSDTVMEPVRLVDDEVPPAKLLIAAMEHRPELKSLREAWLAAKDAVPVAASPLYPQVQLNATEFGVGSYLTNKHHTVLTPVTLPGGATGALPVSVSQQITGLGAIGININWTLQGLGLNALTNLQSARALARRAMLQSNQECNSVISQVRQSYLNQLSALRRRERSLQRVAYANEELRLSRLRLQHGLGKNIDVLRAQQDLTGALVQHAQSTIEFNIAQVQLLHDIGMISRETLLSANPLDL